MSLNNKEIQLEDVIQIINFGERKFLLVIYKSNMEEKIENKEKNKIIKKK